MPALSLAGVSKKKSMGRATGFEDKTQGTLFFEVARILRDKKPDAFPLENVKNLTSHDHGKTFKIIMQTLEDELGYDVHYKVLDSRNWTCQHRERIYIVGFKKKTPFDWNQLDMGSGGHTVKEILVDSPDNRYILSDKLWDYLRAYKKSIKRLAMDLAIAQWVPTTPHVPFQRDIIRTVVKSLFLVARSQSSQAHSA